MKNRGIAAVILLPFVTFGIYALYWFVKTKGELNEKGAEIPTAWLLIIPLVNIYWMYKYYEGAEKVTDKKVSAVLMFVLGLFVTSLVPMALCQDAYNNLGAATAAPSPAMPVVPAAITATETPAVPVEPVIGTPVVPITPQVATTEPVATDDSSQSSTAPTV